MKIGIYCNIEKHMYIEVDAPSAEKAAQLNREGAYKGLWAAAAECTTHTEQFNFAPQINYASAEGD